MSADDSAPRTWQPIADALRDQITTGDLPSGTRLPGRRTLMDTYGVADRTVALAVHALAREGLVRARPGAGWYVRSPRPVIRSARNRLGRAEREAGRGAFSTDAHAGAWRPDTAVEVTVGTASEDVADALDVDPGQSVLVRDRVMRADGEPVQLAKSYLPRQYTEGTRAEDPDSGPGGLYARLEEQGHRLVSFTETVRVGTADEHEAVALALSPGASVLRITRVAYTEGPDQHHVPVEVNYITAAADRWELIYELPAT